LHQPALVNKPKRLIVYLERALEIEHQQLPSIINPAAVWQDYGLLLEGPRCASGLVKSPHTVALFRPAAAEGSDAGGG